MQKQDYQKILDKILQNLDLQKTNFLSNKKKYSKPTLLLHACCAPCSSYVLEYLAHYFDITIFYYNPNIYPKQEYIRRLDELKNFLPQFIDKRFSNQPQDKINIEFIEQPYNPDDFFNAVQTEQNPELKTEKEKGERCRRCYEFRLKKAFDYANKNKFDYFTTTLSISPFKDADKINDIGKELENSLFSKFNLKNEEFNKKLHFLTSDFKKKGGFKRSLEISKEFDLYRQDYCGCIFSKQNMQKFNQQADN